jgi:hypothetical protein
MIVTVEFFLGLIAVFLFGYLIATILEKIFHINFDEPGSDEFNSDDSKKFESINKSTSLKHSLH